MVYRVIDNETGKVLHSKFPRHGALMWAARWCDANEYTKIDIDDKINTIYVSQGLVCNERRRRR